MMKDINEVIRKKEAELQQVQREMEALRVAARLLSEEAELSAAYTPRAAAPSAYAPTARPAPGSSDPGYGTSWDAAAKKFP